MEIPRNRVLDLRFTAINPHNTPDTLEFWVLIETPDGKTFKIQGFWVGKSDWRVRFAPEEIGHYSYTTICTDTSDPGLHEQRGKFDVIDSAPSNPLYAHGRLHVHPSKKFLEHADGTPFFWLGDTWWMGLTARLHWPEEFQQLTADRVQKGFTVIQIVAGLYPDMPPFDERGANEAGFPWSYSSTPDGGLIFDRINPDYFDLMDRRIAYLVESGLVPCIVGFWGYFLLKMGLPAAKKHWQYLIARYGAYPVVWCIAGEAMMKYYLDPNPSKPQQKQLLNAWSQLTEFVKQRDPFHNPITIHPTQYGHRQLDQSKLLDINMLQTGHANILTQVKTIANTERMVITARKESMPVVVGEVCYEGIMETNHAEIQRCLFWATFLSGGVGFTYGANGIWQMNRKERPFGPSPYGISWGHTSWDDAAKLPGSASVGIAKSILCRFKWWEFMPHPEWVKDNYVYCGGIAGEVRVCYLLTPKRIKLLRFDRHLQFVAYWINIKTGDRIDIGQITPDTHGTWLSPSPPLHQDWILVVENHN
jgi:hypothetical protein